MNREATELNARRGTPASSLGNGLAQAFLILVMALGSLVLWTVIPFGWLQLSASLSDSYTRIYVLALLGCPAAMMLWGWGLYRVNRLYLRLCERSRGSGRLGDSPPALLDVLLVASAALALILLAVWWLALAHPPTSTPWPDELSGGGA